MQLSEKSDSKMAGGLTSCAERGVTARLTEKLNWTVKCEERAAGRASVEEKMAEKKGPRTSNCLNRRIQFIYLFILLFLALKPWRTMPCPWIAVRKAFLLLLCLCLSLAVILP